MSKCILIAFHDWPNCSPQEVTECFGEFDSEAKAHKFVTDWQRYECDTHHTKWLLTTLTKPRPFAVA